MRRPPILGVLIVLIGLILAACGSPSGDPAASAGGEPSVGSESQEPGESQSGGGGGGPGSADGSVQFEMTGGHNVSDELPFAGNFAYFQQAGVSFLVFTDDTDATEANGVIITIGADGTTEDSVFQYVTDDLLIPAANCEWNITRHDASGAAGSFTCNDVAGFSASGGAVMDIDVSGSFEASN